MKENVFYDVDDCHWLPKTADRTITNTLIRLLRKRNQIYLAIFHINIMHFHRNFIIEMYVEHAKLDN